MIAKLNKTQRTSTSRLTMKTPQKMGTIYVQQNHYFRTDSGYIHWGLKMYIFTVQIFAFDRVVVQTSKLLYFK